MKVKIRRFRQDDKTNVLRFLKSFFAGWQNLHQWTWKFEEVERALDRKVGIWVVEDRDEIVGHLAFIPMNLRVGKGLVPVCQLVDGALSSRYRHGGVYASLVKRVLQDAEEGGNSAAIGFANRPSYRVYIKSGHFRTICSISRMFKTVDYWNIFRTMQIRRIRGGSKHSEANSLIKDLFPTLRRKALPTLLDLVRSVFISIVLSHLGSRTVRVKTELAINKVGISSFGLGFEDAWTRLSSEYRFVFERDYRYLKWRYSNPRTEYEIFGAEKSGCLVGYVVIAVEERQVSLGGFALEGLKVGYIVDLVADQETLTPLFLTAEEAFRKRNVCILSTLATEGSRFHSLLKNMKYRCLPKEIGKIILVASVFDSQLESVFSLQHNDDILLTLGDSDLV